MTAPTGPEPLARGSARGWALLAVALLAVVVVGGNWLADELVAMTRFEIRPSTEDLAHRLIMVTAVAYAVLIAIPFVPGVEVGLALIGLLGAKLVPLVYLCTLLGLLASFTLGRLLPPSLLARLFASLSLHRASALVARIEPMDRRARLAFIMTDAPGRLVPLLVRHRYVALAVVLNVPGNFLLGGGGGIALIAGATGLYSLPGFVLATAIGVAPLPIAIMVGSTVMTN